MSNANVLISTYEPYCICEHKHSELHIGEEEDAEEDLYAYLLPAYKAPYKLFFGNHRRLLTLEHQTHDGGSKVSSVLQVLCPTL